MTEHETETDTEQTPFVAPDGADTDADPEITEQQVRDAERDDDDEPPEQIETADEPELEPAGMTERQMEAGLKKIERARSNFYNRVSEIMGEAANDLTECPACAHFIPGLIFPQPFDADQLAGIWPYLGLPNPNELQDAPDRHVCNACQGRGKLNSGSLIPEYATVNCRTCKGRGYTDDVLDAAGDNAASGGNGQHPGDQTPPMPEDEAWVQAARERGYTIVPPFAQANA